MTDDRRKTDPFMDDLHTLVTHVQAMRESLAKIEIQMMKVDDHHKSLYGVNGMPGVMTIVDRLNETEKDRKHERMAAWTAIVGLSIKTVWDMMTHKP